MRPPPTLREPAATVVLRLSWRSRHQLALLSSALARDYYLRTDIPPPGCNLTLTLLDEVDVHLNVVSIQPIPSVTAAVTCAPETQVFVLPALPPSLSYERLLVPSVSCFAAGRELPYLLRLSLRGHALLQHTGFAPPRTLLLTGAYGCGKTSAVALGAYETGAKLIRVSASDVLRAVATRDGIMHAVTYYVDAARAAKSAVLLLDDAHFLFAIDDHEAATGFAMAVERMAVRKDAGFAVVLCCSPNAEAIHEKIREVVDVVLPVALDPIGECAVEIASRRSGHSMGFIKERLAFANVETVAQTIEWAQRLSEDGKQIVSSGDNASCDDAAENRVEALKQRWSEMSSHLGGLEEPQRILKRVFLWRQTKAATFATLGVKPSTGVLLYGCPGTGKTALIRQAAAAAQFKVIPVDAASLARGEVGASERLLSETFKKARQSVPCVIFMDEIDALFATATATSPHLTRLVAALSLLMDNIAEDVVVVGATNRPWMVSKGLLRPGRFEHCVKVSLPNAAERRAIAAVYAPKMELSSEERQCLEELAQDASADGFSGADISGACRRAAMSALCRRSKIEKTDLEKAFRSTTPSVNRSDGFRLESWEPPR